MSQKSAVVSGRSRLDESKKEDEVSHNKSIKSELESKIHTYQNILKKTYNRVATIQAKSKASDRSVDS